MKLRFAAALVASMVFALVAIVLVAAQQTKDATASASLDSGESNSTS